MENDEGLFQSPEPNEIKFSAEEKLEYLSYARKQLIKLLGLIEDEKKGGGSAALFFAGLLFDLNSADMLFGNRFAPVLVKLNGLYVDYAYRKAELKTVKNKIFESRGILEGIMKDIEGGLETPKRRARR